MSDLQIPSTLPRYRQILKGEVPAKYLKPDNMHLLWFIPHVLIIATCFWVMAVYFRWWLAPFLGIIVGHSFGCLGFIAHETCHGGAIKNKTLRHLVTAIAFSPFGIGPHLWAAARDAVANMIDLLCATQKLDPVDAYMLVSTCGDLRISEIVDMPNVVVSFYVPRSVFE